MNGGRRGRRGEDANTVRRENKWREIKGVDVRRTRGMQRMSLIEMGGFLLVGRFSLLSWPQNQVLSF